MDTLPPSVALRPIFALAELNPASKTLNLHTEAAWLGVVWVMKHGLHRQTRSYLLFALITAAVILVIWTPAIYKNRLPQNPGDNPQDFFLRGSTSSFSYNFRYDPRAADEWLFHFGARLITTSAPPMISK